MLTDDEILSLYNAQREKTTNKQINYIQTLYGNLPDPLKQEFTTRVASASNLEEQQVFVLIEDLKRKVPVTPLQLIQVLNQFDESDIQMLIKKTIDQLTLKDAETLLLGPDKFKPWIKEHPIISEEHYEYGWQESDQFANNKMYYLKFYDMMMIDVDTNFIDSILESTSTRKGTKSPAEDELKSRLSQIKNFRFRVYQSHGGFHIFIISHLIKYNDEMVFTLTKQLGGDIYYALFANKTGFKVRLSPKLGREEQFISKFVYEIGSVKADLVCKELIKIHDQYTKMNSK